jgi:hypothetical protein
MEITQAGNVGIGTTTPAATLDVSGTDALIVPQGTTAQRPGTGENGMLRYNSTTSKMEAYENGAWTDLVSAGGSGDVANGGNSFAAPMTIGTNDAQSLTLETSNSPRMTILDNGLVGINNTNPSFELDVQGGLRTKRWASGQMSADIVIENEASPHAANTGGEFNGELEELLLEP